MKTLKLVFFYLSLTLISTQVTQMNQCPQLICDDYLGKDVCFLHSGTNPVTFIRFKECDDSNKVCDMGSNYAWLDA